MVNSIGGSVENNQPNITNDAFHTYLPDKPYGTLKLKLMTIKEITDIINYYFKNSFPIIDLYLYCLQYQFLEGYFKANVRII